MPRYVVKQVPGIDIWFVWDSLYDLPVGGDLEGYSGPYTDEMEALRVADILSE